MRTITEIKPLDNFNLICSFDNGQEKQIDLNPIINLPAFAILKENNNFSQVVNKKYFIEWPMFEVDLSADTLFKL